MSFQFGSSNNANNTGFNFTGANTISNSLLGNKSASSLNFGGTNANTPDATGFSFANVAATNGNTASPATNAFSFGTGGTSNTSSSPASGFGFGTNNTIAFGNAPGNTAMSKNGTSLSTPNAGFSFGTNPVSNNLTFGSNTSTSNKPLGLNSFSSPNPPSGFGSLIGNNATNNSAASFPAQINPILTGFGAPPLQLANNTMNRPLGPVSEAIEKLLRAYAPLKDSQGNFQSKGEGRKNDECHFKTVILTQKPSTQHRLASATTAASSDHHLLYGALLEEAEKDNIDPSNYVPTEEIGIDALKNRFENQMEEISNMNEYILKVKDLLKNIYEANQAIKHRILLLKMKQTPLNQKLLLILRKIEVLRCHGNPLQTTERQFQQKILHTIEETEVPKKKLEDISVNLALQKQPKDLYEEDIKEEDLTILITALKRQHEGLEYLMEILRKDTRDLAIMKTELQQWN